jgi:NAD dependent epimerase/dehydratase family enzyme
MILVGQRVLPSKALALGYVFRYTEIDVALGKIFSQTTP